METPLANKVEPVVEEVSPMTISKQTKNNRFKSKNLVMLLISILIVTSIIAVVIFTLNRNSSRIKSSIENNISLKDDATYTDTNLQSRKWMEYSMDLIRKNKPTPPESARFYAYVSTVFNETLIKTHYINLASDSTRQIINQIYPQDADQTNLMSKNISSKSSINQNTDSKLILDSYINRIKTDGHDLIWDGKIPTGNGIWKKTTIDPFSPRAGEWKR